MGRHFSRSAKQQIDHPRVVAHRFAIFDDFARSMGDWSDKFKLSGDDCFREVTFTNKIRNDVNIITLDHSENFPKARFLFPKAAIDFRKDPATNDLVRMLEGWRTRIRIEGRSMTYQN